MKSVPLTRARHASNFVIALEEKGVTIECLQERPRFSTDLLENSNDDGIISALSMLDFAETAAQETGICDLGFWAGMVPLESFGEFVGVLNLLP